MITGRDRITIRDYLNQFSDRWPEEYVALSNKNAAAHQFQLAVLLQYLKWARPDREDAMEIWDLIQQLEATGAVVQTAPVAKPKKVRYKVLVEDITNGQL